jgi:hypothetical protein
MMYDDAHADWGHRDNILDKHHTHVGLGIVYDDYYFAYVQNFEDNYITLERPVSEEDGLVRMQGEIDGDYGLSGITIFYDETPTVEIYNRDKELSSYSLGEAVAGVTRAGWYYDEIETVNADRWTEEGNKFDIVFDLSSKMTKAGVYTIVVTLEDGSESFPALGYSIFQE